MNWDRAIELLENGEARMVVTQTVVMRAEGKTWVSFNGEDWEETDSEMIKNEIEE